MRILRRKEREYIYIYIYIYILILLEIFFFFALSYSAQPYIAVHCSNEGKNFTFNSIAIVCVFVFW